MATVTMGGTKKPCSRVSRTNALAAASSSEAKDWWPSDMTMHTGSTECVVISHALMDETSRCDVLICVPSRSSSALTATPAKANLVPSQSMPPTHDRTPASSEEPALYHCVNAVLYSE